MPRTALRCSVQINIHAVSCPGVWMPRRDDVFLTVTLFNQVRRTCLSSPIFPVLFHERFRFDRVFYSAFEPAHVADQLKDMKILIELIQRSPLYEGGRLLAYHEGNACDFLYPFPSYSPTYGTTDREILLEKSLDFPGISPKLQFATKTTIEETTIPVVGSIYNKFSDSFSTPRRSRTPTRTRTRSRSASRSRSRHQRPTISSISRSRSVSPSVRLRKQMIDLELESSLSDDDIKPPFVVKKVTTDLIGRVPGTQSPIRYSTLSSGKKRPSRLVASTGSYLDDYEYNYRPRRYVTEVTDRYPIYTTDPLDYEVETLRIKSPGYVSPLPRSTSPLLYRSSLRDRYDERPWSPTRSELIHDRVDRALARSRSQECLDTCGRSYLTSSDSLDRLALDCELERAKLRSMALDRCTELWEERTALCGTNDPRKKWFADMQKAYIDLYRRARPFWIKPAPA